MAALREQAAASSAERSWTALRDGSEDCSDAGACPECGACPEDKDSPVEDVRPDAIDAVDEDAIGVAHRWVKLVPARRYFVARTLADGAGVPIGVARCVIATLLAAQQPIISEPVAGLCCREPPPADDQYGCVPFDEHRAARLLLPAGSGLSGLSALSAVGWIHQGVVRASFAVPQRDCRLPDFPRRQPILEHRNDGARRRHLTWHEATLLEALQQYRLHDPRYDLRSLLCNLAELLPVRGGGLLLVRRDELRAAADACELPDPDLWNAHGGKRGFMRVVRTITRHLPRRWEEDDWLGPQPAWRNLERVSPLRRRVRRGRRL
ncbi:hypothetical protein [Candidatus Poriferisodalis sp.]|uniref:hypothetical protein n=1 Tax=Candidatus Poriferisodalis sp. TaxID=3101277 RepID=UPI003B01B6AF